MNTPCAIVPFAHFIDSIVQAPQRTASFIHGLSYHQIDALTLIARQGRITQPQLAIAQAYRHHGIHPRHSLCQLAKCRRPGRRHRRYHDRVGHVEQVAQCGVAITQLPILVAFVHLTRQLHHRKPQQGLPQHRHKQRCQACHAQAQVQIALQTCAAVGDILILCRYRQYPRVIPHFVDPGLAQRDEHVALDRKTAAIQLKRKNSITVVEQRVQRRAEGDAITLCDEALEVPTIRFITQAYAKGHVQQFPAGVPTHRGIRVLRQPRDNAKQAGVLTHFDHQCANDFLAQQPQGVTLQHGVVGWQERRCAHHLVDPLTGLLIDFTLDPCGDCSKRQVGAHRLLQGALDGHPLAFKLRLQMALITPADIKVSAKADKGLRT